MPPVVARRITLVAYWSVKQEDFPKGTIPVMARAQSLHLHNTKEFDSEIDERIFGFWAISNSEEPLRSD